MTIDRSDIKFEIFVTIQSHELDSSHIKQQFYFHLLYFLLADSQ